MTWPCLSRFPSSFGKDAKLGRRNETKQKALLFFFVFSGRKGRGCVQSPFWAWEVSGSKRALFPGVAVSCSCEFGDRRGGGCPAVWRPFVSVSVIRTLAVLSFSSIF